MKELSIEEKAIRYDEATEVAREYWESPRTCIDINVLPELFPELKESEDEKMIKELISLVKETKVTHRYYELNKMLAWLEKQGEQKTNPEPKFEEGDIVKHSYYDGLYYKVKSVDLAGDYELECINGKKGNNIAAATEDCLSLWTIQDAKDGDVLNSPSHYLIWIYKDNDHYHACVNMNYVTENVSTDGLISIPNDACPATKDEQTILFARMKEAGYEWDAEEKELKKIEQKPAWSEKIKGLNELETYILSLVPDRPLDAIKVDAKNIRYIINKEQNPAWSEEDDKILKEIITDVKFEGYNNDMQANSYKKINWLKSIRPQSEWKPSKDI